MGIEMSSELTQTTARVQLYECLRRTLGAFPAGSTLSLVHPEIPHARLHGGVVLPYRGTGPDIDTEFFDIGYWVTGIAPDVLGRCFDHLVRCWIEADWPTRVDRDCAPRAAYTSTPDRFGLSVRESVEGYVSVSGTTPPFARGGPVGEPFPESIDHPSSPSHP